MRVRIEALVLPLALLIAGCSGGSSSSTTPTPTPTPTPANASTVDFGTTYQTIRGFGGSTAWISDLSGTQADSLFGTTGDAQIGLSILRVRIDPGGAANWGTELNNAQLANARGASVIATPWTPPAAYKSNDNIVGGSLNPANYGDYANYLESFVTYMAAGGVKLYGISMQNEPDAQVSYESCTWTGAQMDMWVANNASVLTTKLLMPESESSTTGYSDPTLNDPSAVGNVAIVAGHIYGSAPAPYPNASSHGKELWMTEHYTNDTGITGAMELAMEVHASMVTAGYNAYLWWWIENYAAGGYGQGLMDASQNLTTNGFALGQFSKFVRPGYVRVSATANPQGSVYVSAYEGSGHFVIVAINNGTTSVSQPFAITNQTLTSLTPYQTSATEGLAPLAAVAVTGNAFTYTLPGQSVTTFVQ